MLSFSVVLSTLMVFTLRGANASPTTVWVPDDYPTIQEAVDAAEDGDTIRVRAGTYIEEVVIQSKSISLIGDDASNTTIRNKVYDSG